MSAVIMNLVRSSGELVCKCRSCSFVCLYNGTYQYTFWIMFSLYDVKHS